MKTIRLPYTPSITLDKLREVLQREYPDKGVSRFFNTLRIAENAFRHAQVSVSQKEKQGFTEIHISATFPLWFIPISLVPMLFVPAAFIPVCLYSYCCDWPTDVAYRLNRIFK